ncbi:hypothetical protein HRI_001226600 [Hibiscus trionum]|uniref:Endonuclease/exonuclease/phosphatase domain-containing protein n=1 Tax=Hibiscus trionum TaxID=183268 RepID=A0A9W7LSZ8_HIBTR|nr:hypothetical protein HRI_001226600 [Hibiscus trionum]
MIKFLFWNCQGAASPEFWRYLKDFLRHNNPHVVALFEPRINGLHADMVIARFGLSNSFRVEASGLSGGIWLLLNDVIDVEILKVSNQFVHGQARLTGSSHSMLFTVVYASPNATIRRDLWACLSDLNPGDDVSWLLGGDFNAILRTYEQAGVSSLGTGISQPFQDFVFTNGLVEAVFRDKIFTSKRGHVRKHLDRCLFNKG